MSLFAILKNRTDEISPRMSDIIIGLYEDWLWLDERIQNTTSEIELISKRETNCLRFDECSRYRPNDFNSHGCSDLKLVKLLNVVGILVRGLEWFQDI